MKCRRDRCPNNGFTRGLCNKHYKQFRIERQRLGVLTYVDAARSAEHLHALIEAGLSRKQVSLLARVSDLTLANLQASVYPRVQADTEARLLAVPLPTAAFHVATPKSSIDSTGTVRRLRALVAIGYSQKTLARDLQMQESNLAQIVLGHHPVVRAATARSVRDLYRELAHRPPARPNNRAIKRAAANSWPSPMAWDDDTIDDPNAAPFTAPELPVDLAERRRFRHVEFLDIVADHRTLGRSDAEIAAARKQSLDAFRHQLRRAQDALARAAS